MAVGTHKGFVQIWDAAAGKKLSVLEGHTARVGKCDIVWNTAAYKHMISILRLKRCMLTTDYFIQNRMFYTIYLIFYSQTSRMFFHV